MSRYAAHLATMAFGLYVHISSLTKTHWNTETQLEFLGSFLFFAIAGCTWPRKEP